MSTTGHIAPSGNLRLAIARGPKCPRCGENRFDDWWHDRSCKSAHSPVVDLTARLQCHGCGIFFAVTRYHDGETHSSYRSRQKGHPMPVESRDDLVKRLQAAHAGSTQRVFGSNIFEDAATRIESDAKRIAELEAEIKDLDRKYSLTMASRLEWRRQAEKAERALAEERERCARIAESVGQPVGAGDGCGTYIPGTSADAARAIRASAPDATAIRSGKPDGKE